MLSINFGKRGSEDEVALSIASSIANNGGTGLPLLKRFYNAASGNEPVKKAAAALRLAGTYEGKTDGALGELTSLVASSVDRGANAEKALELFTERLESSMRERNRFRAKTGAPLALIYMGMGVFFPMFSGISTVILVGSLGASSGVGLLSRGFLIIAALYVAITLYLSSAFAHPERGAMRNLASVLPYLGLGLAIMLTSHTYLSRIL